MSAPDMLFHPSSFGGGWLEPITQEGHLRGAYYFETPSDYYSAVEAEAWMLEPYEVEGAVEQLRGRGLVITRAA